MGYCSRPTRSLETKVARTHAGNDLHLYRRANIYPGKGIEREQRRLRTLPVDKRTLDMLRNYIDRGGPPSGLDKQLLFGINRHRAWQIVRDCAIRAGLPSLKNPETGKVHHVSPHRLRDAFAVMVVKKDDSTDSIRMLQEHLGHASIGTTMRYRKISGQEHQQWYERL